MIAAPGRRPTAVEATAAASVGRLLLGRHLAHHLQHHLVAHNNRVAAAGAGGKEAG